MVLVYALAAVKLALAPLDLWQRALLTDANVKKTQRAINLLQLRIAVTSHHNQDRPRFRLEDTRHHRDNSHNTCKLFPEVFLAGTFAINRSTGRNESFSALFE